MNNLQTAIGDVTLANPILTASGTYGSGREYENFVDLKKLGGIVTKSVTLKPTRGNPPPRVVETPSGMLNAIGLQNEGLEYFLKELLPPLQKKAARVIVNIAGKTENDYVALAEGLSDSGIDALEVNISCPNVKEGGMAFGVCENASSALVKKLRKATRLPLWVKLSPNVTDIRVVAQAVEQAGADALVVANTFLGIAIDIEKRRPILGNVTGGLSGPAVHPLALRLVWQVAGAVKIPLIGVGGVAGIREVIAFLLAGASAVEVGTMNFVEPDLTGRLVDELSDWLKSHKTSVSDLIGALEIAPPRG
jgi:dihydroorotate dehydrogenase (NAD+) catalytic subunit